MSSFLMDMLQVSVSVCDTKYFFFSSMGICWHSMYINLAVMGNLGMLMNEL